jgi:hypothetical protein
MNWIKGFPKDEGYYWIIVPAGMMIINLGYYENNVYNPIYSVWGSGYCYSFKDIKHKIKYYQKINKPDSPIAKQP